MNAKFNLNLSNPVALNITLSGAVLLFFIWGHQGLTREIIVSWMLAALIILNLRALFIKKIDSVSRKCPYAVCKEDYLRNSDLLLDQQNLAIKKINRELENARKAAEKSERLQSAFLSNMSHEIRTPLNAIIGFTQLLVSNDQPDEIKKAYVDIINQNTNDLLNLIDDILHLSKIESGIIKNLEMEGSVAEFVNEVYYSFKVMNPEVDKSNINFVINNKVDIHNDFITTDFLKLKQVLYNLIINAFKFTKEGYVELGCEIYKSKQILFYVKDTGIGIPKDQHKTIFERFRQLEDKYLTREYRGVGLGLNISKRIIELLKGKIWLESEVGQGATFFITIPTKKANSHTDNLITDGQLKKVQSY